MAPTIRTVASYNTHQEHSVDFFGNELIVTVTPTASVISRWINNVQYFNRRPYSSHPLVVGVGVQWTPAGHQSSPPRNSCYADPPPGSYYAEPHNYCGDPSPGSYNGDAPWNGYYYNPPPVNNYADPPQSSYADPEPPHGYYADPPPDTLQLCVGKRCLIIQLSRCDRIPEELRSFLTDPETIFVGVWNGQDAGKLARSEHGLEIGELLDIRNYVQHSEGWSMRRCSFEEIVEECMGYQGVRLDPGISMSDWSVFHLCHEQILQASLDAYVCFQLGVWARLWQV